MEKGKKKSKTVQEEAPRRAWAKEMPPDMLRATFAEIQGDLNADLGSPRLKSRRLESLSRNWGPKKRDGVTPCKGATSHAPDGSVTSWDDVRRMAELDLQMDVYASGSANIDRIAGRATLLCKIFMGMINLKMGITRLSEWGAALWTRPRPNDGTKTAGSSARTALQLAERFTGERFSSGSALVRAQAFPKSAAREASEAPKSATPPTWKHIEALESTITMGATVPQRILAGISTFLVHASHRYSNGQRSRRLVLTSDALLGESLLKGKPCWRKWAASRLGLMRDDWAGSWMQGLMENGMPGFDLLILAPDAALNRLLRRPARFADFSLASRFLLMVYGGETPDTVVEYTPHGCRHVQVTAAAQLASQGLMSGASIEVLGHWEKGSKMPRLYDSSACVTELATRKRSWTLFGQDGSLIRMETCPHRPLRPWQWPASQVPRRWFLYRRLLWQGWMRQVRRSTTR